MASPTKLIGKGVFGIKPEPNLGLIAQSISYDIQAESATLNSETGATVGVAYFDEKVSMSISTKVDADTAWTGTVGSVLTLVNTVPGYLFTVDDPSTEGLMLIESINVSKDSKDFNSLDISATFYPSLSTT